MVEVMRASDWGITKENNPEENGDLFRVMVKAAKRRGGVTIYFDSLGASITVNEEIRRAIW